MPKKIVFSLVFLLLSLNAADEKANNSNNEILNYNPSITDPAKSKFHVGYGPVIETGPYYTDCSNEVQNAIKKYITEPVVEALNNYRDEWKKIVELLEESKEKFNFSAEEETQLQSELAKKNLEKHTESFYREKYNNLLSIDLDINMLEGFISDMNNELLLTRYRMHVKSEEEN